jgi:hypothetical protein
MHSVVGFRWSRLPFHLTYLSSYLKGVWSVKSGLHFETPRTRLVQNHIKERQAARVLIVLTSYLDSIAA